MIKAVVWDMGGVLVSENPPESRGVWERQLGLSDGELARMVFWHPVALDLALGKARPSDLWRLLEGELSLGKGELDGLSCDFWGEPEWHEDVFAFVGHLRASLKQAVLSDAWIHTRGAVRERINESTFDLIMFSAEEGVKKPSAEIFNRAAERLGVVANEIIFVDDRLVNIEGARRVGMRAVEFADLSQVRPQIDEIIAAEC